MGLPLVFQLKYTTFISYLKEINAEFHGIVSSNCDYFYLFCKVGIQKDIVNNGSIEPKHVTVVRLNSCFFCFHWFGVFLNVILWITSSLVNTIWAGARLCCFTNYLEGKSQWPNMIVKAFYVLYVLTTVFSFHFALMCRQQGLCQLKLVSAFVALLVVKCMIWSFCWNLLGVDILSMRNQVSFKLVHLGFLRWNAYYPIHKSLYYTVHV